MKSYESCYTIHAIKNFVPSHIEPSNEISPLKFKKDSTLEKSVTESKRNNNNNNINNRGTIDSLEAVGGSTGGAGGAGDQGKKKGNAGVGEHGFGSELCDAGNGLEGLDTECSLEEIRSWGSSFDKLMKSQAGRKFFREFLLSEYSDENIAFWLACEQLKRESNSEKIEENARYIYDRYISTVSEKEVGCIFIFLFLFFSRGEGGAIEDYRWRMC